MDLLDPTINLKCYIKISDKVMLCKYSCTQNSRLSEASRNKKNWKMFCYWWQILTSLSISYQTIINVPGARSYNQDMFSVLREIHTDIRLYAILSYIN